MSQSPPPRRGGPKSGPRRRSSSSAPSQRKSDPSIAPLHPTLEPPDIKTFTEWNLGDEIQGAIAAMGITTPTPIQRLAIQPVLDGRDVIAKAETGTGKTLAFGAPMMAKIDPARASVLGLVLCPTRELAEQGQKVLEILGKPRGIKVALVVGGEPLEPQVAALKGGAQLVVGTPGRILDLYKQRFLSFPWTEFAILDEADVMLEIGFIDDVKMILSYMPDERQTLLFSATFPPELLKLAREYTKNPVEVATASGVSTVDTITQSWIPVDDDERPLALIRLIEQSAEDDVFLVFCDRRTEVDKLMRRLERLPFSIKALHGGYDQAARFRVMSAFRTGEVKVLVATDVASRGLDVVHVTTVLNYSSPQDITDYTHRIGRTGRAGRKGRAITLVGGMDMRRWKPILHEATWDIPEAEAPRGSRMGPRREERREAPRENGFRTRTESAPLRSDAQPAARWPVDQDAHDETVTHGDVRPNRASPRHADADRPRRSAPPVRSFDEPKPARGEPRGAQRAEPREARAAEPSRERHAASARPPHREDRQDARRGASNAPRREQTAPPRAPAAPAGRPGAPRPRHPEATEHRGVEPRREQRPAARRNEYPSAHAPRASESRRDEQHKPQAREPQRREAQPRRSSRPAARPPARPAPEERPPGTFERPMSGGLLGHSARRTPPPRSSDGGPRRRP